jgi:hypothetical protein
MICSGVIVTFGCLYKLTFRKMSLNDNVLPKNVLNEAEQPLFKACSPNGLIPEKSKGRYLSEIIGNIQTMRLPYWLLYSTNQ